MARISTYNEVTPHADDLILGSDMGSLKATKNFKVSSLVSLCNASAGRTLAETLVLGNTTGGTDLSVSANDDIVMTDLSKIIMDSDFKIYKGIDNHSHIEENGTSGDLMIKSNNEVEIASGIMGEHFARFTKDAGVQLFHDNVKKFETTSNNIKVVGVAAHADNSAALAAGLTAGELYRTGDILKIVH